MNVDIRTMKSMSILKKNLQNGIFANMVEKRFKTVVAIIILYLKNTSSSSFNVHVPKVLPICDIPINVCSVTT